MDMNFANILTDGLGLPKLEFLDEPFWYWLFIGMAVLLSFCLAHIFVKVALKFLIARQNTVSEKSKAMRQLFSSLRLVITLLIFMCMDWLFDKPGYSDRAIGIAIKIGLLVAFSLLLYYVVDFMFERVLNNSINENKRRNDLAILFTKRVLKAFILVFSFTIFLSFVGIDTKELIVGIGISGLAVAFALKPTIENLFSGALIAIDQAFIIGDFCTLGNVSGTIEDIGLRSVKVRTSQDTIVTIPNASLTRVNIENLSLRRFRKIDIKFYILAIKDADIIKDFLDAVKKNLSTLSELEVAANRVVVSGIDHNFLEINVMAKTRTPDFNIFLDLRGRICLLLVETAHENQVTLKWAKVQNAFIAPAAK
jgi:MscS family membrane protein